MERGEQYFLFLFSVFLFLGLIIVLPCQLLTQSVTALCQSCQTKLNEAQVCASFVKVVTCICQGSDVYCVIIVTRTSCQSKPSWSLNKISKVGKIVRWLNRSLNSWLSWSTQWGWSTKCLGQLCHWRCFISREGREILRRSHFWDHLYMLIYLFFS